MIPLPPNAPDWQREGYPHLWLPYTQMQTAPAPLAVVGTEGCRIRLADGRELIDGICSWWSACHGYNHPHIVEAVAEQARTMPHVMFAGLTHEPALRLSRRLATLAPEGLERVFLADSGSVAVEVAMKMAVQYWRNRGDSRKTRFVSFRGAYHGDTMGCMSLSDVENGMHSAFLNYMPMQFVTDIPSDEYAFAEFDSLLGDISRQVAAVVIEPLVQCAGGFTFHSADVLAELYRITKKHNLLFIADEIATGFGRTGYLFACNEAGITPDILCLGKALTGGAMTLAATLATADVFNAFLSDDAEKALMHGPTYMANALACAAANASLDLFEREPRLSQIAAIETQLESDLEPCRTAPAVRDVRVKGAIGIVEIHPERFDRIALRQSFVERGVWLRPYANCIYIMPAYTISADELSTITRAVCDVASQIA